jgi:hypothetical protein
MPLTPQHKVQCSSTAAYELFVKRSIQSIAKEVEWARGHKERELRESCQQFLSSHEDITPEAPLSLGLAVLPPLQLACASSNQKVLDAALGCLHKLVAHAWLQGESSASGEGDGLIEDDTDVVARVIKLVVKCGEQQQLQTGTSSSSSSTSSNPSLQLSIIRALLTFTTAEHFVAHGDCLMSAVRTVFNMALGSTDDNIKRTACNALLQMLNTVAKRVTVYQVHSIEGHSLEGSRRVSDLGDGASSAYAGPSARSTVSSPTGPMPPFTSFHHPQDGIHQHAHLEALPEAGPASYSEKRAQQDQQDLQDRISTDSTAEDSQEATSARMAQFASLAEHQDIRGLEAAIGAGASAANATPSSPYSTSHHLGSLHQQHTTQQQLPHTQGVAASPPLPSTSCSTSNGHTSATAEHAPPGAQAHTGPITAPNQQTSNTTLATRASAPAPVAVPLPLHMQAHASGSRQPASLPSLAQLSLAERDVLLVLSAFCKLASREAGPSEVETYLHQVRNSTGLIVHTCLRGYPAFMLV